MFGGSIDTLRRSFRLDPTFTKKLPQIEEMAKSIKSKRETLETVRGWLRQIPTTSDYTNSKFARGISRSSLTLALVSGALIILFEL